MEFTTAGTAIFQHKSTESPQEHAATPPVVVRAEATPVKTPVFKPRPFRNMFPRVGRNKQCLCGSGKKFENCCLKLFKSPVKHVHAQATNGGNLAGR